MRLELLLGRNTEEEKKAVKAECAGKANLKGYRIKGQRIEITLGLLKDQIKN